MGRELERSSIAKIGERSFIGPASTLDSGWQITRQDQLILINR
jgi:hypothetical protein